MVYNWKFFSSSTSHFSGECENQGSPESHFPDDTTEPAGETLHEPCTPEPPPGPQTPGRPAGATHTKGTDYPEQRKEGRDEKKKEGSEGQGNEKDKSASEEAHDTDKWGEKEEES